MAKLRTTITSRILRKIVSHASPPPKKWLIVSRGFILLELFDIFFVAVDREACGRRRLVALDPLNVRCGEHHVGRRMKDCRNARGRNMSPTSMAVPVEKGAGNHAPHKRFRRYHTVNVIIEQPLLPIFIPHVWKHIREIPHSSSRGCFLISPELVEIECRVLIKASLERPACKAVVERCFR